MRMAGGRHAGLDLRYGGNGRVLIREFDLLQHGPLDALSKRGRADQSEGQDATAKRQFPGHILPPIGDFLPKRVQLDLLTAGHL